jgi:Mn2+/Fe2+ NRAMP family transporter
MMAFVQNSCAKIGMVSGMGLAGVLRKHYSRKLLYPAVLGLLGANTINAGTDIYAIAAALNLPVPIPVVWMIAPIALLIVALLRVHEGDGTEPLAQSSYGKSVIYPTPPPRPRRTSTI